MTIDVPDLADKTYEDLFEAAEKRLPAYDDGWTDYNPSDPGIVLLELLAFLADTYLYQLDAITDEHRRKYLRLMGESPRPPEPASLRLALRGPDGAEPVRVPAGTQVGVVDEAAERLVFETTDDIDVLDASIAAITTHHDGGRTDQTFANDQPGMFYRAFGPDAAPGSALYVGLDGDPFAATDQLEFTVAFHDDDLPPPAAHGDEDPAFYPSVNVAWEYCTDYEHADEASAWRRLSVARDGTYAFYRGGQITLARPEEWTPAAWGSSDHGINDHAPGLIWLRCRVLTGGYEIPPRFDSIRMNVVPATHRRTIDDEVLRPTTPSGDLATLTAQTYAFQHTPVLEAAVTVDGEPWTMVADLDNSGPTDRHYVLDPAAGVLQFGDGVNGRMPPPTATVVADRYVQGGGRAGNVPASSNLYFLHPEEELDDGVTLGDVAVAAATGGVGGRDPESIEAAFRRTRRDMRTPYRAVTRDDYRYIATHTPGLRFGRATVLVGDAAAADAAAVVVVVVPYAPLSQRQPTPSPGFLEAVQRHVDTHRLIADRVTVEPPTFVDLSVEATVQTAGWIPEARVQAAIEASINEFIHAVHGFEGDGWPFGRTLYKEELVERIAVIDFIDQVQDVGVHARGNARVDGEENILIDDATLLALREVQTEIRAGSPRGED